LITAALPPASSAHESIDKTWRPMRRELTFQQIEAKFWFIFPPRKAEIKIVAIPVGQLRFDCSGIYF
jgi:hypothetical protein